MEMYQDEESKQSYTRSDTQSFDSNDEPPVILSRKQRLQLFKANNQPHRPTSAEMLEVVQANSKDYFGMNELTHWDEHLIRQRIRATLYQSNNQTNKPIKPDIKALLSPEKKSRLLASMHMVNKFKEPSPTHQPFSPALRSSSPPNIQPSNQTDTPESSPSIISLHNVDPSRLSKLGAAVLSLAAKFEVPKEIEGISTSPFSLQQSTQSSNQQAVGDLNEFDFNFQTSDHIDRTFLTSLPDHHTASPANPALKPAKSWFEESDVDSLITSLGKSILDGDNLPPIPFPVSNQPIEQIMQSILLNTTCITQLPSYLIDLIVGDISLSIVTSSFHYFLMLILGHDRDLINYAQWETNQKKYEEHLAEMEALNRINQSINDANNRSNRSHSTKGTTRYTYYESHHDDIDDNDGNLTTNVSPDPRSSDQSDRVSPKADIRPPTVVLPPAPFRPQQSPLTLCGPVPMSVLLPADHRQLVQLDNLCKRLSFDYLKLFASVSPSMKDCMISLYYDIVAESLYTCYLTALPAFANLFNTPIFRQRLVRSTCALLTGFVSANCNSDHWKSARQQQMTDMTSRLSKPTHHTSLPHLEPGVPLLMTRKSASIEHSPLIKRFFEDRDVQQKHLRLGIKLSMSFPMALSSELIDLRPPEQSPSSIAARAKYQKDKQVEVAQERREINTLVALKHTQQEELAAALEDRANFASKLVEQCQSDKYGGLKMQGKQLALKRLNHLKMST